ncbi:PAS domain S-box protein [Methylobacterium sp. 77]|uniref:PAS domain S-box protein n=1 Tax=Methylobacterium sp. 77 TaxID=1101192 RepID=UPI0018CA74F4|nr:PAS domain S-box protein [Methylobacterium sp. 77]
MFPKPRPATDALQILVFAAGLLTIAVVWIGLSLHLSLREQTVQEQAARDVVNLSIAVEQHVERLVVGIDQVMRFIAEDHFRDPETFNFHAWLQRATSLEHVVHQISLFDEHGDLISSRTPPPPELPRINVRDRVYFQALSANPDEGLYIDRTMKGRFTGADLIQTARRLNHPDGRFAGVIVTSIDPAYLAGQFKAFDLGAKGSIALIGKDGFIRARSPQVVGMYEMNTRTLGLPSDLFQQSTSGSFQMKSPYDQVTRIYGYRSVGSLPLIVNVGQSLDEVMAPLADERLRARIAGAIVTVLLLAFLLILLRGLERGGQQRAALTLANVTLAEKEAVARQAVSQTHEANRLLSLAAQIAHIGHWRISVPGRVLYWSDEVFRIHGRSPEGGPPSLDTAIAVYHPDDRDEVARCVADAMETGQSFSFSARIITGDGDLREVVSRGLCEQDAVGATTAVFGTVMDVTDLRQTERAVVESEARYRLLADHTSDMIVQVDLDTTRRYVSPACKDILGYEPEELIGTKPIDMVHHDDRDGVAALLAELTDGRRSQALMRQRYRRKDGAYVWVEVSYQMIHDSMGQPVGCVASTRNITPRVEAEQRIRESEHRFRLLAENTSELIMLGHDDGRRSYISPASERLLGYTPKELGAMRLRDYVHPDDLESLFTATRPLADSQAEATCEYRSLHKTRGWIWVEGVFRRIPDAQPNEATIVATFRDVSERRVQREALADAKVAAERASAAKTEFLASMSHEIRTPLNAIIGFTDLLVTSGRLPQDLQRPAELVRTSSASLLTIVNDILDFSKVEAGAIELDRQAFDPRALIYNSLSIVRGTADQKGLEVRAVIDPLMPKALVGDESRLRQVLLNLLNNAIKFTHRGSITLNVQHGGTTDAGERLRFSVSDTGIGIARDQQERLFKRFSQVDGSIERDFGGTGLGLAICKQLVDLMGGEIGVLSEAGIGATFWFSVLLPRGTVARTIALATDAPAARRSGHLLLVEDNVINQELARAVLEVGGHTVDVVADGEAAILAVEQSRYDIVLMDVQMAGMNGMTATRRIRTLGTAASTMPIIAMTANVLADQIQTFRAAGMDDHIGKPFKRAELYRLIDKWLAWGVGTSRSDTADASNHSGLLDQRIYDETASVISSERLAGLLEALGDELAGSFLGSSASIEDREQLRFEAHTLMTSAGMLGFSALSNACRDLESVNEQRVANEGERVFQHRLEQARSLCRESLTLSLTLLQKEKHKSDMSQQPSETHMNYEFVASIH